MPDTRYISPYPTLEDVLNEVRGRTGTRVLHPQVRYAPVLLLPARNEHRAQQLSRTSKSCCR